MAHALARPRWGWQATVTRRAGWWTSGPFWPPVCVRERPDAPAGTCTPISTRYIYRSFYRIILLGCRAISILKRPQNRVFQHLFAARRPLASLRSTLNYANLCTLPKRGRFTSFFDCFVVIYPVSRQLNGETLGVFSFYRVMRLCAILKIHRVQAASVAATCHPASPPVLAPERVPWVCAPIRATGSKHGRIWIRHECLFEPKASLHIDPNSEYCRCSPEGAADRGACPWHTLWREPRGLGKGLFVRQKAGENDPARRRLRKGGQSKISLWRCARRTEGCPEF